MHDLIESFAARRLMRIFSAPVVQQKHNNNNLILAIAQINMPEHDQMRIMHKKIQHNTNDVILVPHPPPLGSSLYRSGYMTLHAI